MREAMRMSQTILARYDLAHAAAAYEAALHGSLPLQYCLLIRSPALCQAKMHLWSLALLLKTAPLA